MKKHARNLLVDRLHKGVVWACVGMTLYGTVILGDRIYRHFRYVKPQIEASKSAIQQELLAEGSSDRLLNE